MAVKKKSKASSAALAAPSAAEPTGTGKAKKKRKNQDSDGAGEGALAPLPEESAVAERRKKKKKAKDKPAGLVDQTKRRKVEAEADDGGPVELVETAPPTLLGLAPARMQNDEEEEAEAPTARPEAKAQKKQRRKGKRALAPNELSGNAAILESVLQKKSGDADSDSDSLRNADFIPTPGTQDREESLKVFVGGLFWKLDPALVRKDFEECGPIHEFDMPNSKSGSPMGIAFIVYKTQQGVDNALSFDGDDYHGRQLNVKLSNPPKGKGRGAGKGEGKKGGKGKGGKGGKGKTKGKGKGKGKKSRFE